ncbi:hypothetical protein PVA45_07620 (plasmid) [Entomospira entomophila]|uniref:Uncharacterized protein n=1 Tax=Entomospira entomophila TaxID=2719988 RepID=A0A968GAV7_9SPIO|nr:hypothetical protein [Entomospira entomophilus]NIZ41271.1 hypothetical protein [Entomospira entomophilus]WDI36201.1 hypothetical protein PVA45_07620 [Entomospira entomophilus]
MSKVRSIMEELMTVKGLDWPAILKKRYNIRHAEVLAGWFLWYGYQEEVGIGFDDSLSYDRNLALFTNIIDKRMGVHEAISALTLNMADENDRNLHNLYTHFFLNQEELNKINQFITEWKTSESFLNQRWYLCYAGVRNHLVREKTFIEGYAHDLHTASDHITNYLMGESDMDAWMNHEEQDFTWDLSDFMTNLFYEEYELSAWSKKERMDVLKGRFNARFYASHDLAQLNRRQKDIVLFDLAKQLEIPLDKKDPYGSAYYLTYEKDPVKHAAITRSYYTTMDQVVNPKAYAYFLMRHGYHEHV